MGCMAVVTEPTWFRSPEPQLHLEASDSSHPHDSRAGEHGHRILRMRFEAMAFVAVTYANFKQRGRETFSRPSSPLLGGESAIRPTEI